MTAGSRVQFVVAVVALVSLLGAAVVGQNDTWGLRGGNVDDRAARNRIAEAAPEISGFDVMVILIDGLSPESLGCYGEDNPTTRRIDALAKDAFRFTNAYSVSPHRLTSVISILNSQYPATIQYVGDMTKSESAATMFRDRGYRCFLGMHAAVLDAPGEPVGKLLDDFGFDRRAWSRARSREPFTDMVADHLASRRLGEPVFGVLHYSQTYPPAWFHPGKDFGTSPEQHRRAALAYVNEGIGAIVDVMRKEKTLDRTIFVITSPHALAIQHERGDFRQDELTDAALRVPLIVRIPGVEGRVIDDVVETIEILPTLMTVLDHEHDYSMQGRSFADLMFGVEGEGEPLPRYAHASHMPFIGEPYTTARATIRDSRWRLTTGVGFQDAVLSDTTAPDSGNVADASPEIIARLLGNMEDVTAYIHTCGELWKTNRQTPPDLSPVGRLAARASWLAAIGDPRSIDAVRKLIESGDGDMFTAIRVLLAAGDADDLPLAEKLLEHPDHDVAALAGAFLVRHGKVEIGLDYAISGLRPEVRADVVTPLLRCLAESDTRSARAAIERYRPRSNSRGLAAERDLALAKLGSEDARDRLAEHVLAPHVVYDKRRYIAALREYRPERVAGLIELCLTDGDGASDATMLDAIAAKPGAEPERAVAASLDNGDPAVRARAFSMLRSWGSLAGYAGALQLLRGEPQDTPGGARALLTSSVLIGSPLLPGIRFDQNAGQFLGGGGRLIGGLPDVGTAEVEFTVSGVDAMTDLCAVVFAIPDDVTPEDLKIRIRINDGWARTLSITPAGNDWIWVGVPPATRLEAGANRVGISIGVEGRKGADVIAKAFAFLPPAETTSRPLAAIETTPLLDPGRPALKAETTHDADFLAYHLWLGSKDAGRDAKLDRVVVKIGGEVVLSGALPRPSGKRKVRVPIPDGTRHGARIEVLYEDRSPGVNATILLIGDR